MVKGKGSQSFGKRHTKVHKLCPRCGDKTYHIQKKQCSSCAFPSPKIRKYYGVCPKARGRKGEGSGRMRSKTNLVRRAKNGFRASRK